MICIDNSRDKILGAPFCPLSSVFPLHYNSSTILVLASTLSGFSLVMHPYSNSGHVEVVVGCMESGKTEELRRRIRRALIAQKPVAFFVCAPPDIQTEPPSVATRKGHRITATLVSKSHEVLSAIRSDVQVVAIDEAHFFDDGIVDVVRHLATDGKEVVIAALDTDFRGRTFGPIGQLLAEADAVDKLYAVCTQCHGRATRTQRLVAGRPATTGAPTVQGAEHVSYEPRCRACHLVPEETSS